MDLETIKAAVFEVYAAGYEQAYSGGKSLAAGFLDYWRMIEKELQDLRI